SRRSCDIICARISSALKFPLPIAAVGSAAGVAGGVAAAAGAAAWPLPGNFTVFWHFGHLTLNARSGTRASSITILLLQLGQADCIALSLDQVVHLVLGLGRRGLLGRSRLGRASRFHALEL